MTKRIKEPEEFVKINNSIRAYGGMYANWKSSGLKAPMPKDLLERVIEMHSTIEDYLLEVRKAIGE